MYTICTLYIVVAYVGKFAQEKNSFTTQTEEISNTSHPKQQIGPGDEDNVNNGL